MKFATLLITCLALLSACQNPEACLTADRTNISVMDTIVVKNCSKDADRYIWTTGGATRVDTTVNNCSDSVIIYYQQAGVYMVTIEAGTYDGAPLNCIVPDVNNSDEASITITVN